MGVIVIEDRITVSPAKLAGKGNVLVSSTRGIARHRHHTVEQTRVTGFSLTAIPPDADWQPVNKQLENQSLDALNLFRQQHGLGTLVFYPSLMGSAEYKSMHMATYDYMEHDDPETPGHPARSVWARFTDNGYSGAGAENICYGSEYIDPNDMSKGTRPLSPQAALNILVSAGPGEGHYDNIVNSAYNCVGIGVSIDKTGNAFYTQDFGILPSSGPRPIVTGISPSHGKAGDTVVVSGQNLDNKFQDIIFNSNKKAVAVVVTPGAIRTTVPVGAATGPIIVATGGGFAASPDFTVETSPTPPPNPPPTGGSVFDKWKTQVWPLLKISSQWHNFVGNPRNEADVALITKLLENPHATGTAKSAFAKAIVADIRLAASN